MPITGSFSTAPAITSVKANNLGNDIGLSIGDTLEITFDKATNSPEINAENLKNWFAVSNSHIFGTLMSDYDSVWDSTGKILTITFSNVTGSTIAYGDTIHVTAAANIMDSTGEIKVSEAASPPVSGSFTSPPKIYSFTVDSSNPDGILGTGDIITIGFDQLTNKPTVTASILNDWFILKNNDNSTRKFPTAGNISSVIWTTLDGQDYLKIVLSSTITPSTTSIVIGDTYIDFKTTQAYTTLRDITNSIQGIQRLAGDGILVISGNY